MVLSLPLVAMRVLLLLMSAVSWVFCAGGGARDDIRSGPATYTCEGAELIVHGESWFEANAYVQESLAGDEAFIHPFDHPLLWQGHSSLIDEVVQCGINPSVVVLSVGGGGLLCGAVEGMQRVGWHDVPVLAAETEGAESFAAARAVGRAVRLPAITSIASSLGARQVCDQALTWADQHPVISEVVSDAAALIAS